MSYRYCIFSGGKFRRWEGPNDFSRKLENLRQDGNVKTTEDVFGSKETGLQSTTDSKSSKTRRSTVTDVGSFRARQLHAWGHRSRWNHNQVPQEGVIIVSYFLPVILRRSSTGTWSASWDVENVLSLEANLRMTWIGSVRYSGGIPPEEEDAVMEELLRLNCHPIFINSKTHYQFYDIFCKKHLWPVLHHIADVYAPLANNDFGAQAQQDLWFTYTTVNRLFRDKIVEVYQAGDLVWIHGFHLMLVPTFLRKKLQLAKIGVFFHTPFPSSEIWRTMPRREDLLRGILGADQIGFHLYEYARHFLSSCRRLLGLNGEMSATGVLTIHMDGREVAITSVHVGIDLPRLEAAMRLNGFEADIIQWKKKFARKIVIAGA